MNNLAEGQQKVYDAIKSLEQQGKEISNKSVTDLANVAQGTVNSSLYYLRDLGLVYFTTYKTRKRTYINYDEIKLTDGNQEEVKEVVDEQYTNEEMANLLEMAAKQLRRNEEEFNNPRTLLQRIGSLIG